MNKLKNKKTSGCLYAIVCLLIVVLCAGICWGVTCGVIKLICMCFGLEFKWLVATGIWLIILLLRFWFKSDNNK